MCSASGELSQRYSDTRLPILALVHVVATWFMVGLIWTIHFVHYPLFAFVGEDTYVAFQAEHVERIGRILLVPWAIEGGCVAILLFLVMRGQHRRLALPVIIGAVAMAVILGISGFLSAPAHGELADGFDAAVHSDLMLADLFRTLAWTLRGVIAVWIVVLVWKDRDLTESRRDQ